MAVVDVDFDVRGAGAAGRDEEGAGVEADFRGRGREGGVWEADVEEAAWLGGVVSLLVSAPQCHGQWGRKGWPAPVGGSGGAGCLDSQTCDGISVWICGCIIGYGLGDSACEHVYRKERFAERGILRVNIIHVIHRLDQGWDVELVEIEAPDVVEVPFDASEVTGAEPARVLQIFPGDLGDVLVQWPEID